MTSDNENGNSNDKNITQALIRKRGSIKGKVTRIKTFLENFNPETQLISNLTFRLQKLEECWSDFNNIQLEIQAHSDDTADSELCEEESANFEEMYFNLRAKMEEIVSKNENIESRSQSSKISNQTDVSDNIQLPNIPLPSFSGNYEEWTDFHDVFESMIHNSTKLTQIQKFYYLRSCLKDEALKTIKEIKVSSNNYESAWELLTRRFKNTRLIIKAHVQGILSIKRLDKPQANTLKDLYTTVNNHVIALKNLGEPTDEWSTLLVFIITHKLDPETRDRWESHQAKQNLNENDVTRDNDSCDLTFKPYSFQNLMQFLFNQTMIQEVREENRPINIKKQPFINSQNKTNFKQSIVNKTSCYAGNIQITEPKCSVCNKGHLTFNCTQLLNLNSSQRFSKIRELKLCINCLRSGHKTLQCKSPHCCKHCKKRHHSILHVDTAIQPTFNQKTENQNKDSPTSSNNSSVAAFSSSNEQVILATAVILINDNQGTAYPCRALLDSGSQSNFMSQALASALGLEHHKISLSVSGIGPTGTLAKNSVNATIRSRINEFNKELDFIVLNKIVNDLPNSSASNNFKIPADIKLADETFFCSRKVDLLLGAGIFFDILRDGQIRIEKPSLVLQNTVFGWIVSGKLNSNQSLGQKSLTCTTRSNTSEESLEELVSNFWRTEEISMKQSNNLEEQACEAHFISHTKRLPSGKFVVKLPFSDEPTSTLGNSKELAFKRFLYLERKLSKDTKLKEEYAAFLNEYLENDEMQLISSNVDDNFGYYMPHHPVIRESSSTTRVRVVFDASAKTTNGNSLNDILMVGPTIQRDLTSILLSFRIPIYVFTADIKQMYRKILVDEDQQRFQRIMWRDDSCQPVKIYQLKTVTYGTASAPFLAIRTLSHLAEIEKETFPVASEALKRDFYVDDVLTGRNSLEEAINLRDQLINILQSGGFELRKWCANHPALLTNIPTEHTESGFAIEDSNHKAIKTLGIYWQPSTDSFRFNINLPEPPAIITKRIILSDISRLFDPIGLLSPIVITAKLFMQEIWLIKNIGWDEEVPEVLKTKWLQYRQSLTDLNFLSIDRRVLNGTHIQTIEIHGFCDASQKAYGACLYVRTISDEGNISVNLLCSKSRVAPLKLTSLPRLELCGAVLLAQLLQKTKNSLEKTEVSRIILWTDSTIVLHWLNSPSKTWQTYVGNRVAQIQDSTTNCTWRHIRSRDNPADLISRSVSPKDLSKSQIWWSGPVWLSNREDCWPETLQTTVINPDIEERRKSTTVCVNIQSFELIDKFSSWNKLLRITALCLRFIGNCRKGNVKRVHPLTSTDLFTAEIIWIKYAQQEFSEDINKIKTKKEVSNRLKSLMPFIDEDGILRVGGRLKHASIPLNFKHPMILPPNNKITKMISKHIHISTYHPGPQALLSTMRTKYWPINGKILTRSITKNCVKCSRTSPKLAKHIMGDLPSFRVQPSKAFENCGVDYCGPFYFRRVLQRRSQPVKAYAALFICMATKAIHIELVPDLTTRKFLEALERMIARRGAIKNIYSDNASNFIGAKNELQELKRLFDSETHQYQLSKFCASEGMKWHFIPARSPHFGGIWEAGVKTVKGHLKRVLGKNILSYDELETLFIKIESCVNSRPLTALSNDPNDLDPLTPSHFLIIKPSTSIPISDVTHLNENRLDHWQQIQRLQQIFWKRWTHEYLSTLQQRQKWNKDYEPPKIGTLVILHEDFQPPLHWPLGRIVQLHPGEDGKVRVVTVRTSSGLFKRALRKLSVLPVN